MREKMRMKSNKRRASRANKMRGDTRVTPEYEERRELKERRNVNERRGKSNWVLLVAICLSASLQIGECGF